MQESRFSACQELFVGRDEIDVESFFIETGSGLSICQELFDGRIGLSP